MTSAETWGTPQPLSEFAAADLGEAGHVLDPGDGYLYRTTGQHLSQGGMGVVWVMERKRPNKGRLEAVVGKTFHAEYLYQLRTDEVTRREYSTTLAAIDEIAKLRHPFLLPTYVSQPIKDNHLIVSPRKDETLLEAVARGDLPVRRRVELLLQALHALVTLHEKRLLHRDFTLRNILLDGGGRNAYLFDFDLSIDLDRIGPATYASHYQGRIFGSPGYSVPPEILDPGLTDTAITTRLDVYAIGGALFTLFTDQLPYGHTEDMWGLLVRISDGVVVGGQSHIDYPEVVPLALRPIIEGCLERDPGERTGSVASVIEQLNGCLDALGVAAPERYTTLPPEAARPQEERVASVHQLRKDASVTREDIVNVDDAVARYGYVVKEALGRVKEHGIFLAIPNPELVASGQFPDTNMFPKIVTAQDLSRVPDRQQVLDLWFGRYLPVLHSARQGLLTTLYRAVYDEKSDHLFLFSEFVTNPRFGTQLEAEQLSLREALGVGYLVACQVMRLHEHGIAHNNVSAKSLLLKGLSRTRQVFPAMIGLVEPSVAPAALTEDVRNLAMLTLGWIEDGAIEALEPRIRMRMDDFRERLTAIAFDESVSSPLPDLIQTIADGLSSLDFNFGVLRENGGDLDAYALLLVSHSLYGRLWD